MPEARAVPPACTGGSRPSWSERVEGEDSERTGLLSPGYQPESSWDPQFVPGGPLAGDMLRPLWFTHGQCDSHWRPVPRLEEFIHLLELKARERPARLAQIKEQHRGSRSSFDLHAAFTGIVSVVRRHCGGKGDYSDVQQVFTQLDAAEGEIHRVVLAQKCWYNRARPYQYFPELDPPFCPAHPSYPSGHSTQAHALAFLLHAAMERPGDPHRAQRGELGARAWRIAENREVAGVHFRSDTEAGIVLARRCVDEILAHASMAPRLAQLQRLFTPP